jgi:hypothetical protein
MAPPNDATSAAPAMNMAEFRSAFRVFWMDLATAAAGVNIDLTPARCDAVIHACDDLRLFIQNTKRSMGLT